MDEMSNSIDSQKKLSEPRYECVSDRTILALDILMKQNKIREKSEFAKRVGLSREYISLLMNKKLKPTLKQAQQILTPFNLYIWDIFTQTDIRDLNLISEEKK